MIVKVEYANVRMSGRPPRGREALAIAGCVVAEYPVPVRSIWVWRWFN